MSEIDAIFGYNHVIKKEIWDGYMQGKLPMVVSDCLLEWKPAKNILSLENPAKPKCPECFAENKLSAHLTSDTKAPTIFVQLPIQVEAMQLTERVPDRILDIIEWGRKNECKMTYQGSVRGLSIFGRYGITTAREGDWIVKRTDGAFDIMRPDAFWASYEAKT